MKKLPLRLNSRLSLAFWATLSLWLSWWIFTGQPTRDITLYSYSIPTSAHWITTSDSTQYTACLRKDIELPSEVSSAHISVACEGGFELLCNGNPVGAQTLWRPTRHFQNGLTASGQRISSTEPVIAYNFPREYQWSDHQNQRVLIQFDLTPYLRKGLNSIALQLESRDKQPAALAFGQISLKKPLQIPLQTDSSWKAQPVPDDIPRNDWSRPSISLNSWKNAQIKTEINTRPSYRALLSSVPPKLYTHSDTSRWIIAQEHDTRQNPPLSYTTHFNLPIQQSKNPAWIRILSHSDYWIWINGKRLQVNRAKKRGFNGGEWFVSWQGRRPLATPPVLLDPDETSEFFGGSRYLNPRHGDPTKNDFKPYQNTANQTSDRPNQNAGDLLKEPLNYQEEKGRSSDPYGFFEEPHQAIPHTLLRRQSSLQYHAYDISQLIHPGKNSIQIRLVDHKVHTYRGSQSPRFSLSGMAGGQSLSLLDWKTTNSLKEPDTNSSAFQGAVVTPNERPPLQFMGSQSPSPPWLIISLATSLTFLFFYWIAPRISWLKNQALTFSLILLLVLLLISCFQERSEILFIHRPQWPISILSFAGFFAIFSFLNPSLKIKWIHTKGRYLILGSLLLLTFILRFWNVSHQPIDDDEYASIQAVLSITETGVPSIAGDIWYSRSPLYHYMAGLFAKVFGTHIWSLRLYSVLLAVLTGALLWFMARYYFKDIWIAHASLLIFALHPFLIFSGHIARFYQQQQFFVLLMIHLFITGFLHKPTLWRRVGAILAFTGAVLSQEISLSFVPVFFILYLMFGQGVSLRWEIKAILYIILAGILVTADVALFQVKCLTRSVGVSPNVEATLSPTFWEIGNLFSLFIGYSRLHLFLSVFYIFSFLYSIRRSSSLFLTLHLALLISIIAFNFIITSASFRYLYALLPLWILLGCHGLQVFGRWVSAHLNGNYQIRRTVSLFPWLALAGVIISFSPWRILSSYNLKLLGDPISGLAYVREHLRPEDRIMITEPHPHAAKIELGRVDYDLVIPILYDFTYCDVEHGGALRDRNGNALVVNRLAELQQIFSNHQRVWILLNREKFRSRKKNIRWEYPGAREELFIRQNCQLKYRSYLWSVYLWDQDHGTLNTFRKEPHSWVE